MKTPASTRGTLQAPPPSGFFNALDNLIVGRAVPEPSSALLALCAAAGLLRRKRCHA
jgi:PEP-CTERM motif